MAARSLRTSTIYCSQSSGKLSCVADPQRLGRFCWQFKGCCCGEDMGRFRARLCATVGNSEKLNALSAKLLNTAQQIRPMCATPTTFNGLVAYYDRVRNGTHRIDDMPLSKHFYYVKPASGFELWPEMGAVAVCRCRTRWTFADLTLLLTTDTTAFRCLR